MTTLDLWLKRATRRLSRDSALQVRTEISEHYESARQAALSSGLAADIADREALASLGDPKTANRQYRKVLLTSGEARVLRQSTREARAFCSHARLRQLRYAIPVVALIAAVVLYLTRDAATAQILLIGAIGTALLLTGPSLPIYTVGRSRVFRYLKWIVLAGMPLLAFGAGVRQYSWLVIACLWPVAHVEFTRAAIRRKIPIAQWPKHLYL